MGFLSSALGFLGGVAPFIEHEERESQFDASLAHAQSTQAQNIALQREFAKHGVRWRVEDAEAAGLHPLFALTGGGAAFAPNPVSVMEDRSSFGSAVSKAAMTAGEALRNEAMLEGAAASAKKDFAISSYYDALASKLRQGNDADAPFPDLGNAAGWVGGEDLVHQGRDPNIARDLQPFFDRRRVKPREVTSANSMFPSETAGTSPHWDVFRLRDDGMLIQLPAGTNPSEAYESMAESKTLLGFVIARNVEKYGARWMTEFIKSYGALFNWE